MAENTMSDKNDKITELKQRKKHKFSVLQATSMLLAAIIIVSGWTFAFFYLFDVGQKNSIFGPASDVLDGKIICIDAGGGTASGDKKEPLFEGSEVLVSAYGESAKIGGVSEEEINLLITERLKKVLEKNGAVVYLTRDSKHSNITNTEKAQFANTVGADLFLQIYCGVSENESASGISVAIPTTDYNSYKIYKTSYEIAENILKDLSVKTKAKKLGIIEKTNYTELNWVRVPAARVTVGYISNKAECKKLLKKRYQKTIAYGIVDGLARYFTE